MVTRRSVLIAAAAGIGATVAGCARSEGTAAPSGASTASVPGASPVGFHGEHQPGIAQPAQSHARYLAFTLRPGTGLDEVQRMMRVLTDDAVRLMAGQPALADLAGELAAPTGGLTITFGFGPRLLALLPGGAPAVASLHLPAFSRDRLRPEWSGGDLLVMLCGDDLTSLAHAARAVILDTAAFATVAWSQVGFLHSPQARAASPTPRNLLGQVDGTVNPTTAEQFDRLVWIADGPLAGGTTMVVRRISLNLDTWDKLGRSERELVIGRRLADGAPLGGTSEFDTPDLSATDRNGLLVIPEFAHVRRARGSADGPQLLRRGYNYVTPTTSGHDDSGLVFTTFQADIATQFTPIQQRLDELDLMNMWSTAIGSATFAVPAGCAAGEWIGSSLAT